MTGPTNIYSPRRILNSQYFPWLLSGILLGALLLLGSFTYWRSSGVGPQVQVPMFYDAHYLFPRPWTQEQSAPGVPEPAPVAIYGENSVSQSFTVGSDNLARIAFLLSGPQYGLVTAVLTDEEGNVWQAEISLSSGENRQAYSLSIPAVQHAKGKTFTLILAAPGASADQPVVAYTVGGDRLDHAYRLNEFVRPGNLALTTYSKGGPGFWWFDAIAEQLLPSVFRLRLQQYKADQFKGNLFTTLLVITIGLSAVLLVLASPGIRSGESTWRRLVRLSGWYLFLILGSFLLWQVGSGRLQILNGSRDFIAEYSTGMFAQASTKPRLVADLSGDLWSAVREPEARFIHTTVDSYPAIVVPGDSRIEYSMIVPPDSRLRIALAAEDNGMVDFAVKVNDELLWEMEINSQGDPTPEILSWQELDLSPWAGQGIVLALETSLQEGSARGYWFMPQIESDASWVLPALPANYLPVHVRFDDSAELVGIVIDDLLLESEGQLGVQLLWQSVQTIDRYGKVFVHLLDENNQLLAQHDAPPVQGAYPFTDWLPDTIIRDDHMLQVDAEALAAPYRLEIGVYDPDTLERWTAENADGSGIESSAAVVRLPSLVLP